MERTIEQMTDCILFLGPQEWKKCPASVIIREILAYFGERIEQDVQLAHIWEDITFEYLCLDRPTKISEVLDMIARYTGSYLIWQGAHVSFCERRRT